MNLKSFVEILSRTSLEYPTIQDFSEGDIYEYLNSGEHRYPCIFLTVESIENSGDNNTLNATLFYVDRLLSDNSNRLDIQTTSITALNSILEKLQEINYFTITSSNFTPFTEKFADLCAGSFVRCNIEIPSDSDCEGEEYEISPLNITKNGEYEVLGYDKAVVNIQPSIDDILSDKYSEKTKEDFKDLVYNINNVPLIVTNNSTNNGEYVLELPSNIDWSIRNVNPSNWFNNCNFINFVADMYNYPSNRSLGQNFLCNCFNLKYINIKFPSQGPTYYAFQNNFNLEEVVFENLRTNDGRDWFKNCNKLKKITVINEWREDLYNEELMIENLASLKEINGEIYSEGYRFAFANNPKLENIKLKWCPIGRNTTIQGSFVGSDSISLESLSYFVDNLGERPTQGNTFIIKFGAANLAKLTQEQITSMTNKGWTVSA